MAAKTQLQPGAWGGRRSGSFAGKEESAGAGAGGGGPGAKRGGFLVNIGRLMGSLVLLVFLP